MIVSKKPFSVLQWNARGLTKSRLEEFKHALSYFVPSVVLISETHWKDLFNVKFSCYHVIKKNRTNRRGGGVAILAHHSYKFSVIQLDSYHSIEAVGVSIALPRHPSLDLISAYAPRGVSSPEEMCIIKLEIDIRESFSERKSIIAVFLDISKAYDCVWIQGLPECRLECCGGLKIFSWKEHYVSQLEIIFQRFVQ